MPRCESCHTYYWPWSREICPGQVHVFAVAFSPDQTRSYRVVCRTCAERFRAELSSAAARRREDLARERERLLPTRLRWLEQAPMLQEDIVQLSTFEAGELSYDAVQKAWRWDEQLRQHRCVQILARDEAVECLLGLSAELRQVTTDHELSASHREYKVGAVLYDENRDFFCHMSGIVRRLPGGRIAVVWTQGERGSHG